MTAGDDNDPKPCAKDAQDMWAQILNDPSVSIIKTPSPESQEPLSIMETGENEGIPAVNSLTEFERDGIIDPISLKVDEIISRLGQIQKDFQAKFKYDAHKEKIIDHLHHELQLYKNDILKKFLKTFMMDIIQYIDHIRKLIDHWSHQRPQCDDPEKVLKILDNIPSDLEDICFRQGVVPFTCEGTDFDPKRQRVLKRVETVELSKDKSVAEHLRPGYEWDGEIVRPEMVAIYAFKASPVDTEVRNSDE